MKYKLALMLLYTGAASRRSVEEQGGYEIHLFIISSIWRLSGQHTAKIRCDSLTFIIAIWLRGFGLHFGCQNYLLFFDFHRQVINILIEASRLSFDAAGGSLEILTFQTGRL
jgi:hypothetical protein